MSRRRRGVRGFARAALRCVLGAALVAHGAHAAEETDALPATEVGDDVAIALEAIRRDLTEVRFEAALAAIETLLGEPGLGEDGRVEALALRSQAHVALGDLDAAASDYREILALSPGFEPDPVTTPAKARSRFEKVQAELVGEVTIAVDPPEARLFVDGRPLVASPERRYRLLVGQRALRAESLGHDPLEQFVEIAAGSGGTVELRLVPNARSALVRTAQDDVEVSVDGRVAGRTRRPDTASSGPAELLLELLPLGEHVFELSKPCHRAQIRRELIAADLLDRTPQRLPPVDLVPAYATLVVEGGPAGSEIFVGGASRGLLPLEPFELCPGVEPVDARLGGRLVWRATVDLSEARDTVVRVVPRPHVALVGADAWPPPLAAFASSFNTSVAVAAPAGADLARLEGWRRVALPADTDLAVGRAGGGAERWYVFSPLLEIVAPLDDEVDRAPPRWSRPVWGFGVMDSRIGGPARVVEVTPGGAAALAGLTVGDRVTGVGGIAVEGAARVRALLSVATDRAPLAVEWEAGGTAKKAGLVARRSPLLRARVSDPVEAALRGAWAVIDALTRPEETPAALANLALLQAQFGQHAAALSTWGRVRWPERAGIGEGTRQYHAGVELARLGRAQEAVRALRAAAASEATASDDEGPPIAPAARAHLADLGVTTPDP